MGIRPVSANGMATLDRSCTRRHSRQCSQCGCPLANHCRRGRGRAGVRREKPRSLKGKCSAWAGETCRWECVCCGKGRKARRYTDISGSLSLVLCSLGFCYSRLIPQTPLPPPPPTLRFTPSDLPRFVVEMKNTCLTARLTVSRPAVVVSFRGLEFAQEVISS